MALNLNINILLDKYVHKCFGHLYTYVKDNSCMTMHDSCITAIANTFKHIK